MGTINYALAVDRVRLSIADYQDPEILDDTTIQAVLTKHGGNEAAATKECACFILGALSRQGRVRLDRIEQYGDSFYSYLKYLKEVINNPVGAIGGSLGSIYAAGIDVEDIITNRTDTTVYQNLIPVAGGTSQYDDLVDSELKYE